MGIFISTFVTYEISQYYIVEQSNSGFFQLFSIELPSQIRKYFCNFSVEIIKLNINMKCQDFMINNEHVHVQCTVYTVYGISVNTFNDFDCS